VTRLSCRVPFTVGNSNGNGSIELAPSPALSGQALVEIEQVVPADRWSRAVFQKFERSHSAGSVDTRHGERRNLSGKERPNVQIAAPRTGELEQSLGSGAHVQAKASVIDRNRPAPCAPSFEPDACAASSPIRSP
jgi:hypothetical protein